MSVQNLVMMAGLAIATRGFRIAIKSHRELAALEEFHARYGLRLANIDVARTRLAGRYLAELKAGRGDDQTTISDLRAESDRIQQDLQKIVDEVIADKDIGIESLRKAVASKELAESDLPTELLTRSFNLPRRVGLQRASGEAMYTYEFGAPNRWQND
jgi:hypothetical protein